MTRDSLWKSFKHWAWQWRAVLVAAPSAASLVVLVRLLGLLQAWEWSAYDQFMRLRPQDPPDPRIAIVGIFQDDDEVLSQELGYIPDRDLADTLLKLRDQQPRAIGFDFYRDVPQEPGRQELLDVVSTTPNLFGIRLLVGDQGAITPSDDLMAAYTNPDGVIRVGSNDVVIDGDGRVRRGVLAADDAATGIPVAGLGVLLAEQYLKAEGIEAVFTATEAGWLTHQILQLADRLGLQQSAIPCLFDSRYPRARLTLGQAQFQPFHCKDGGYINADAGGWQLMINYRGSSSDVGRTEPGSSIQTTFEVISIRDVLDGKISADWARDRIILIGPMNEISKDYFFTPYSASFLGEARRMYGVEIHANIASEIISTTLDGRPQIRTWSEPIEWAWVFTWSTVGAVMAWQLRQAGKQRYPWLQRSLWLGGALGALLGSSYLLFWQGWWTPFVPAGVAWAGAAVTVTAYVARSAGDIRKTFGRYLSDEIVETLLEDPEGLKMGGERRSITILTSDLRGFTATAERLPPEEVIKILNFYLGAMADVITHYNGTIDEFMGDGILVLFGAPINRSDDARRAIACGVAMQQAMQGVNAQMLKWGLPELAMGIGINTGEVVVGNIGSEKRTKYGIVGNQVNLTYRIESYTTGGQILISGSTRDIAEVDIKIVGEKEVQPKGVKRPITIYEVDGIGEPFNLYLQREEEVFVPVRDPIGVQYAILSGKDVGDRLYQGHLTALSRRQALMALATDSLDVDLKPLTNIRLNLLLQDELRSDESKELAEDLYAKVLEVPAKPGSVYIYFTAKPPLIAQYLLTTYQNNQACSTPVSL
ncbi:MAG: adenylate/guanylate cyclase domain-containing protein [Cyanobacteria bacterium P01_H01_bin.121]